MRLVIFDIDGTLTETMQVDEICFVRALEVVFGFTQVETDWSLYRHVTDSGIFHEIHESRTGLAPSTADISRFRDCFVRLLTETSSTSAFAAITGAPQMLSRLSQRSDHRISLATGAWGASARLKMASAGMRFDDYPAASSDDAFTREDIMRISAQRAGERYGEFTSTVYVSDGIWDARACRSLGVPFIGIGSGLRADRLVAEGAACVFPNFVDADLFLQSLDKIERVPLR